MVASRRSTFRRAGSFTLLALAACFTPSSDPATGSKRSAIQGGAADEASRFAVAVLDASNDTCSGTLIAPNLILTARHCIASDTGGSFVDCAADDFLAPKPASSFRVSTAASAKFADAPYKVTKILVPNDAAFCGNDIAILFLDKNVPASEAKPATPALDPAATSTYGTAITAIGYGTSAPGGADDGTRRRRDGVPITCLPDDAASCDPADFQMTPTELATGDGLCEGDSGSGAFVTSSVEAGAPTVIGVLSRASDDGAKCIDAIYTRTDRFADFLVVSATQAAKAGGYPLPSWAGGSDAGTTPDEDDAGVSPTGGDPAPKGDADVPTGAAPIEDGCAVGSMGRTGCSRDTFSVAILGAALLAIRRRRSRR